MKWDVKKKGLFQLQPYIETFAVYSPEVDFSSSGLFIAHKRYNFSNGKRTVYVVLDYSKKFLQESIELESLDAAKAAVITLMRINGIEVN
ncbi:hypothetical protein [Parasutterella muris]|uniref:hypothetical protein n=1 Tax=Parasutterella muris TaxID=2565572 RepID=UPI00203E0A53|nr:hypothetical protein [Parasutterella muris]